MVRMSFRVDEITPELLRREVQFSSSRLAKGYVEVEVDEFLDVTADRLEDLLRENNRLKVRVRELERLGRTPDLPLNRPSD